MLKKLILTAAVFGLVQSTAFAAAKSYQVTGPVTALTNDKLTVQKGSEQWEINRGGAQLPTDVKVGSKVTVYYSMTAEKVESKDAKTPEKAKTK